jgi:cytochrome c oxidase subunit 1
MGAVFAIFAAYYYWSPLFFGYIYNEIIGKIQFWSFFIGVNITFFPMHFLGLASMPRRIADYPDIFGPWNKVSSIGSMISFMTILLFLYLIYRQFTDKIRFKGWISNEYFFHNEKMGKMINSLEWLLETPPKFHHFNQIPII